ncbi:OLC1v1033844C2 [Oldenlandia corymbosa var. corymbosa]|uniref:OLC1v1033844C2 n=2 Tax=Oldenlandia corymbosa var. corymbosa TaxID=529605 RepID=A0AAV1CPW1_OLDCO|nr:OLC1v1033844C2 [Oldenlandia corymbosa var. corymbosa]
MHSDMELQIHMLEQEAYRAILRAFKAQSDALTWEKEELITELRKELRVSDDEHRQLLSKVNDDGLIQRIREWRKAAPSMSQPIQDQLQAPTDLTSRKRPRTSQPVQTQSVVGTKHPSALPAKRGPGTPTLSRRHQHYQQSNHESPFADEYVDKTSDSSLLGRKVMRRWSEDNNFYEAIIIDYDAIKGMHALVYQIDTPNESKEWVDLKEIPPEDIRWIGDDPVISRQNALSAERSRGSSRDQLRNDSRPSQNGAVKKAWGEFEILHTDTLLWKVLENVTHSNLAVLYVWFSSVLLYVWFLQVEKVVEASHPDLREIEKAKKMLEVVNLEGFSKCTSYLLLS